MNYLNLIYEHKFKECFSQKNIANYSVYICLRTNGTYKNRVLVRKNDNSIHYHSNLKNNTIVWDIFNPSEWKDDPASYPPFDSDWTPVASNVSKQKAMKLAGEILYDIAFVEDERVDVDFGNADGIYTISIMK